MSPLRITALVAAALLLPACFAKEVPNPTNGRADVLTIASSADADALLPPLVQTTQGNQAAELLFEYLAEPVATMETFGDKGFKPALAASWSWAADSLSIAFVIDARARWHDGQPVRARDVQFSFALYTDSLVASPHAGSLAGIDSVSVRDSVTTIVWWSKRHPEQFCQVACNLAIMPEHLLAREPRASLASSAFAQHPVGSGRYRFEQWTRQRSLILVADTANFRGRPNFYRVAWVVAADPTAAALSVLSGQADVLESVRGDAFVKARQSNAVRTVEYGSFDYAFLQFNVARTVGGNRKFFGDRALRVAITAAMNRQSMVQNALDSLGAVALGPFTRASVLADTTMRQIAFDTAAAAHVLDSLGWKLDARDGVRKRNGKTLQFELLAPSSSATRQKYAVLIQAQLAAVGIKVNVAPLEMGLFASRLSKGDFDVALNMWRTSTSPTGLQEVWHSPRGKEVAANYGRYSSAALDAVADSAAHEFNATRRQAQYRRAYQLLVDDAAAVWLYEPRNFALVSNRVETGRLRTNAWWSGIPEWRAAPVRMAANH